MLLANARCCRFYNYTISLIAGFYCIPATRTPAIWTIVLSKDSRASREIISCSTGWDLKNLSIARSTSQELI
jgi:hypothetical protein